ncbi:hypothetical protein [Bacillus sp. RAR_GA_16]|uniref:hypothetical protein n=1 Tax=Bacillus sp. RAR_GA_16 TaxID=2876774 RepID=UPI001CCABFBC|nr:hypothetical protein [Bacillus sp. RAR_GA_16]MCA0173497.1 hypothetical protein [Bacillus sp. RAR_GA_16]
MDILSDLHNHFWSYLLFITLAGALGGVGNILISGEFQRFRKIVNHHNQTVYYSIGSIKEPFVGAIGGILTTLLFIETASGQYLLYLALLTGFGSSAFLKRYVEQKTDQIIHENNSVLQNENIQTYVMKNETDGSMVKGIMSPPPVYLTEAEMERLTKLQSKVGEAVGPKEAKLYQCEINSLLIQGKQRSF